MTVTDTTKQNDADSDSQITQDDTDDDSQATKKCANRRVDRKRTTN